MVTTINVSHYCYNIDVYVNDKLIEPICTNNNKSVYEYKDDTHKKINIRVEQNDRKKIKIMKFFHYYEIGFNLGQVCFWPSNIFCEYQAEIKVGSTVDLCVSRDENKTGFMMQNGSFTIENVSEISVKKEHRNTLIPRNKRISFFVSTVICQILCNGLLNLVLLYFLLAWTEQPSLKTMFENMFSGFTLDEVFVVVLFVLYQFIMTIFFIVKHCILLIKDDGTFYQGT